MAEICGQCTNEFAICYKDDIPIQVAFSGYIFLGQPVKKLY